MRLEAIRVYSARGACRVDAGKFTCFTGKLQVTHVNCMWGIFTCEPQVKLPAFVSDFARASFTVQDRADSPKGHIQIITLFGL